MSGLLRKLTNLGKSHKSKAQSTPSTSTSTPTPTPQPPSSASPSKPAEDKPAPAIAAAAVPVAPTADQSTTASETPTATATTPSAAPVNTTSDAIKMSGAKIAVVTHSLWGHIDTLSEQVVAGLKESGAQVDQFTFAETLPDEVLTKMHANKDLNKKHPHITPDKLTEYDGFIFGFGTRYGRTPAQVSTFLDSTGGLWAKGALVGKFASIFTSSGSQHGGQETTALTTVPFFAHHGVTVIFPGFQFPELSDNSEVTGGSAYGAATISGGDGSRQPTKAELKVAQGHGAYFGKIVNTFVKGKSA